MKKRITAATIVTVLNLALYLKMEQTATAERGFTAIGGEEMILAFGIFLAIYILVGGFSDKKKSGKPSRAAANQTESEQSNKRNRFDA